MPFTKLRSITIVQSGMYSSPNSGFVCLQGMAEVVTMTGMTVTTPFLANEMFVLLDDPLTGEMSEQRYKWYEGGKLQIQSIVFDL